MTTRWLSSNPQWLPALLLALALLGCDDDSTEGPDGQLPSNDQGIPVDCGPDSDQARDLGARDVGALDAGSRDGSLDGATRDGALDPDSLVGRDCAIPDSGIDLDAELDGQFPDQMLPDVPIPDVPIPDVPIPDVPSGPVRIRIVASNLTSGNFQSYDPGHGIRILQGIGAEIGLIQEFQYGNDTPADLQRFVDQAFGPGYYWSREPDCLIPNGVVSKWPIVESGYWDDPETDTREFAWARINIPGTKDLWAISVHLLTANAGTRGNEARSLMSRVRAMIPEDDYVVLGGDFNTKNESESAVDTFGEYFSTRHRPVDQRGNTGTSRDREEPYDWVMPDEDLEELHIPVSLPSDDFPHGLVVDTRIHRPLSDLAPAQEEDSDGPNMQHMAVVRDFLLPMP